jgi:uncharacterized membrane protein
MFINPFFQAFAYPSRVAVWYDIKEMKQHFFHKSPVTPLFSQTLLIIFALILMLGSTVFASSVLAPRVLATSDSPTPEAVDVEAATPIDFSEFEEMPFEFSPVWYTTGVVTAVLEERQLDVEVGNFYTQVVRVRSDDLDQEVVVEVGSEFQPLAAAQRLQEGTRVVLARQTLFDGEEEYVIADVYRLPILQLLFAGFVALVLVIAKLRGILSVGGMLLSLGVLFGFIFPRILAGDDPILVSVIGSVLIATITIYLSHGWGLKSHLALLSLIVTLVAVSLLSWVSVMASQLVGLGSEEAYFLQYGATARINLQGLLLGGIILGALGVLDDIVVSQVSIIEQLKAANNKLKFEELYKHGLAVGKDHVASLVNTLVLAYAGANLPLFLLFYLDNDIPLWVSLNNQLIAEEVLRTLVGSIGLVLAVPLATAVAALAFQHRQVSKEAIQAHGHNH